MNAAVALLVREAIRVLPALVPLLVFAGVIGSKFDPKTTGNSAIAMALIFGGMFGLMHGAIARRDRGDPFSRHRPVARRSIEASSLLIGLAGACLLVCVPWATYTWALSDTPTERLERLLADARPRTLAVAGPAFWIALTVSSVFVWAGMRFAVSTPGIVGPILMAFAMPGFFVGLVATVTSPGSLIASWTLALVVLLAYHAVRQACVLSVTRVGAARVFRSVWALWLAVVLVLAGGRLLRDKLSRDFLDSGGVVAIQEDGHVRNWRDVVGDDGRLVALEFLSVDSKHPGETLSIEESRLEFAPRNRDGNPILNATATRWRRAGTPAGFAIGRIFPYRSRDSFFAHRHNLVQELNDRERLRNGGWEWSLRNGLLVRRPWAIGNVSSWQPIWPGSNANHRIAQFRTVSRVVGGPGTGTRMMVDPIRSEFVIVRFEPGDEGESLQPDLTRVLIEPRVSADDLRRAKSVQSTAEVYRALLGSRYFEVAPRGEIQRHVSLGFPDAPVLAVRQDRGERRDAVGKRVTSAPGTLVRYVRLPPFRPDRVQLGVSMLRLDGSEPISTRAELRPTKSEQTFLVAAMGITTVFGSPLANALAALSDPIEDEVEYARRIVRDPIFAGGEALGWLSLSLLLSALAAAWAHREASRRCVSSAAAWSWTLAVFLLGPVGALWMRLSIPWVAIENGRAVNLDPEYPAEPIRIGTEVFA